MMSRNVGNWRRGKRVPQPAIADVLHSDVGDPADLPAVRAPDRQDDLEDTLREIGLPLRPGLDT